MADKTEEKSKTLKKYFGEVIANQIVKKRDLLTKLNKYNVPFTKKKFRFKAWTPPREPKHPIETHKEMEPIFIFNKNYLEPLLK